jgi:hypothetical protein
MGKLIKEKGAQQPQQNAGLAPPLVGRPVAKGF